MFSAVWVSSSIILFDVSLTWPDGITALDGITASFGRGRTGLVGLNGWGKSTLLRLITGDLTPTSGRITTSADVSYLPQTLPLAVDRTVAQLLGVAGKLGALRAIESGDVATHHFRRPRRRLGRRDAGRRGAAPGGRRFRGARPAGC
jgi:ATPase subunit of ABC transporter with duplicated ATPase domains